MDISIIDNILKQQERIENPEELLGYTLNMPSKSTTSGSRCILYESQADQKINLMNPEVALLGTGFESQIGENSSEFIRTTNTYNVLAKVSKYNSVNSPQIANHHYFLLVQSKETGEYDYIERISYNHITESFGFLYNNDYLDQIKPGYIIPKGIAIRKSQSYDMYNNRQDGINLNVTYMTTEKTKEDSITISDYASEALAAPLIENAVILLNENDKPLNLYGNDELYKCIPDIGENVGNNLLMGTRIENKSDILFSQSLERLKHTMMSDTRYALSGQIVDINIYCNNQEFIANDVAYKQIYYYYQQQQAFVDNFIKVIEAYTDPKLHTYRLKKLYTRLKEEKEGVPFLKETPFSNVLVEIVSVEKVKLNVGDKMTNRYGGKGVVSEIRPRNKMPKANINGRWEYVDVIYNSNTCFNRENPGQLSETSQNFIGENIRNEALKPGVSPNTIMDMYLKFIRIAAPTMYDFVINNIDMRDASTINSMIESIKNEGVKISQLPISEVMTVDKLREIYAELPWIEQSKVLVPQINSNGDYRYIYARRRMVVAKQYFYRLKQVAQEKFSVTSLSTVNAKNENTRNTAKRYNKSTYSKTPIRFFGEMETHDLVHLGIENVIINLMIYSASPHARRLCEKLMTGDPFNINITLDDQSKNRSVEKVNAYLRSMGLKLVFDKIPKQKRKFVDIEPEPFMYRLEEGQKINLIKKLPKKAKVKFMYKLEDNKEVQESNK